MSEPSSAAAPKTETAFVPLDTAQIYTKAWLVAHPHPATAPIALLLFIHGFSEHVDRYDHVFALFAERGIKTFAWDQRGFGKSALKKEDWGRTGGTEKALEDVDFFVKKTKEEAQQNNIPLFLWGHSMGGALALMYASRGPDKDVFRGVVSQAPLLRLCDPPPRFVLTLASFLIKLVPNVQIHKPLAGNLVCKDPEVAKLYDEDPLVHGTGTLIGIYGMLTGGENLLKNPPVIDAPLLVQHGTHDKITDFSATREFFAKLPAGNADREFKGYDGYYHELHNELEDERNVAIKYIADWIVARVGETGAPQAKL